MTPRRREAVLGLLVFVAYAALSAWSVRDALSAPGVLGLEGEWDAPPYPEQIRGFFEADLHAWKSRLDFGSWSDSPQGIVWWLVLWIPAVLGVPGEALWKAVVVALPPLAGIGAYAMLARWSVPRPFAFVGGLVYAFTPFVFNRTLLGHHVMVWDYALLPFALLLLREALLGGPARWRFLAGAVLVLTAGTSSISAWPLACVAGLVLALVVAHDRPRHAAVCVAAFAVLPFLLHGAWQDALNQLRADTIGARLGGLPARFLGDPGFPMPAVLQLVAAGTDYFGHEAGLDPAWRAFSVVPLALGLLGLALAPRDPRAVFAAVLLATGVTVAAGASGPLGSAWPRLLELLPPLRIYREPSHWLRLAFLALAILVPLALERLAALAARLAHDVGASLHYGERAVRVRVPRRTTAVILSLVLLVPTTLALGGYARPYGTGDHGGWLQAYEFAPAYRELYDRFRADPDVYHVVPAPIPYPSAFRNQTRLTIGMDPMSLHPGQDTLYIGKVYGAPTVRYLAKALYGEHTRDLPALLAAANVRYVLVDEDKRTTATDNHHAERFPEERLENEDIERTLAAQRGLRFVERYGSVRVYEVEGAAERVHAYATAALVAGPLPFVLEAHGTGALDLRRDAVVLVEANDPEALAKLARADGARWVLPPDGLVTLQAEIDPGAVRVPLVAHALTRDPDVGFAPFLWTWYSAALQGEQGRFVHAFTPASIEAPVRVPESGEWRVHVRALRHAEGGAVEVAVDGRVVGEASALSPASTEVAWLDLGTARLDAGDHALRVRSLGGHAFLGDVLLLPPDDAPVRAALAAAPVTLVLDLPASGDARVAPRPYDAAGGTAAEVVTGAPLNVTIDVPKTGTYRLGVRAATVDAGRVQLSGWLDGDARQAFVAGTELRTYDMGLLRLDAGRHALALRTPERVLVDGVVLEEAAAPRPARLADVEAERRDPAEYDVRLPEGGAFVVLAESYHAGWRLDGADAHALALGFGNAFHVPEDAPRDATLKYAPDGLFRFGLLLSLAGVLALLAVAFAPGPWRRGGW